MKAETSGPISKVPLEMLTWGTPRAWAKRNAARLSSLRKIITGCDRFGRPGPGPASSSADLGRPPRRRCAAATFWALPRSRPPMQQGLRRMPLAQHAGRPATDDAGAADEENGLRLASRRSFCYHR